MANRSKRPSCVALWYRARGASRERERERERGLPAAYHCRRIASIESLRTARKPLEIVQISTRPRLPNRTRTLVKSTDLEKWQPFLKLHLNSLGEREKDARELYHIFVSNSNIYSKTFSRNAEKNRSQACKCPALAKLLNRENRFPNLHLQAVRGEKQSFSRQFGESEIVFTATRRRSSVRPPSCDSRLLNTMFWFKKEVSERREALFPDIHLLKRRIK